VKRIVVEEHGGPERLTLVDGPAPEPGPDQARIAVAYAGINFIDIYFRTGAYPAERPTAIGNEASGIVTAVGAGVTTVVPGDRVAYAMVRGAYAEQVVVPADRLVPIPADVPLATAAAMMLQGTTAHYLTRSTFPLGPAHTCLVHAAAGGLGSLTVQLAKDAGALVIGTVSTEAKAAMVRDLGADHVIRYTTTDFEAETRRLTDGRGVDVVYDSVGRTTFDGSLKVIRPRGMMVLIGQSSGPVPPLDPQVLNQRGSLFLTRPSLAHYLATREELLWRANDLIEMVRAGRLRVPISGTYPLADAARAHTDLEGRKTAGKLLLEVAGESS
jgi:NADPH2:quinone reductase